VQICCKNVTDSKIDSLAETEEEERDNDDRKWGCADNRDVAAAHQSLSYQKSSSSTKTGSESVDAKSCGDETNGIRHENERHDGIADLVMPNVESERC
jgi:hypothetical protein